MRTRDYVPTDLPMLHAMHKAQGFEYDLPDMDDPRLWITRQVLVDGDDRPAAAILGRLTSEAYFLDFPDEATPTQRMRRFVSLQESACEEGRRCCIDSVHIWLPPEIQDTFGKRLERLGWQQFLWPSYARRIS